MHGVPIILLTLPKTLTSIISTAMKYPRLFILFTLCIAIDCNAQFVVDYNGHLAIGRDSADNRSLLIISDSVNSIGGPSVQAGHSTNFASFKSANSNYNYGVFANCMNTVGSANRRTYGIYGISSNTSSNYNYGVFGCIGNSAVGAGVYGTTLNYYGINVNGHYAGYFAGTTNIRGTGIVANLVTPSDSRQQYDVAYLSDPEQKEDILSRMQAVNVLSYKINPNVEGREDMEFDDPNDMAYKRTHYGVSAQELQGLFPELVEEGQDGYLNVNYMELVPMLICTVQQLKSELEELKDSYANIGSDSYSEINAGNIKGKYALYQASSYPSNGPITIKYKIPSDATNAFIGIFDLKGAMLSQIPINASNAQITLNPKDYVPGMYLYSLIVNGNEVDTKKLVVSK